MKQKSRQVKVSYVSRWQLEKNNLSVHVENIFLKQVGYILLEARRWCFSARYFGN